MTYQFLTEGQVAHFIDRGYFIIREAFSPKAASEWADHGYHRL